MMTRSYERRGSESVHNLLRPNIWLINQNYAVLHDDQTLKVILQTEWDKQFNGTEASSRPDFLCMTDRHHQTQGYQKLVIIEIKRPTVKITMEHITQVMRYKTVLQEHSGNTGIEITCYIVGREIDSNLLANPLTNAGFITKTYTDFIGDARKFYQEYLKLIDEEQYAF